MTALRGTEEPGGLGTIIVILIPIIAVLMIIIAITFLMEAAV